MFLNILAACAVFCVFFYIYHHWDVFFFLLKTTDLIQTNQLILAISLNVLFNSLNGLGRHLWIQQ